MNDSDGKIPENVSFWIEKFEVCQLLKWKFFNVLDSQLKILQFV